MSFNLDSGRYKINLVSKLDLNSRQSQVCVVQSEDIFSFLIDFMKENMHPTNWDYVSCAHTISYLGTVRTLVKFLDRKYNKTLKILYKNSNTGQYQYVPFRSYKLYSKIELSGDVILLLAPSNSKDLKNIMHKVKKWANNQPSLSI